ncbi:MAG TPA: efflux RND transporter periplasmic adaptor subunit [Anaerolineae bacterium]|nr:efflux RND transporter periplasmic adaptor subunit [Anaerolineae bacterium]
MNQRRLARHRAVITCLALLGLLASGCAGASYPWRPDDAGALAASGIIHASQVNVASEFAGRVVAVPVEQGDRIEAGQLLVSLDTTLIAAQIEAAEAAVATAQAGLAHARAGARPGQIAMAEAQLRQAKAGRAAAAQAVRDLQALVADPQEINLQIAVREAQLVAAQHRLVEAEARKDAAERNMNESDARSDQLAELSQESPPSLPALPGLPRDPYLDLARDAAHTGIDLTQQLLRLSYIPYWQGWIGVNAQSETIEGQQATLANLYEQRKNPQELVARLNQARTALAQAEAQVAAAQAQADGLRDGATPEQIGAVEARLGQAQAALKALQTQQQMRGIAAPIDGAVLEVVTRPGEVAAPGATLLTLADTRQLALTVYVSETRIGRIKLEQEVHVTVDSFPGRTFPGQVSHIADSAQFTPRNVSTKEERVNLVFAVEIRLANEDGLLKPGMPADVSFAPGQAPAGPASPALPALPAGSTALHASGTVRARELRIASDTGGRITAILAQAGSAVRAGDPLVELDRTPWLLQLSLAEASQAAAQADLAVTRAGPHAGQVAALRAALALAEAERDGALAAWNDARDLLQNPQQLDAQIIEARAQVALAAQAVQKADSEMRGVHRLRDANDPNGPGFLVTAADEAYAAAQADERTAQTLLEQLEAIRRKPLGYIAQAHAAEGHYRAAVEAVAVAQARLDDLLAGPTSAEISMAEATARQAEAQVHVLQVQLDNATLHSPLSGTVLRQDLRVGEVAAPAAAILTIADLSQVAVDVYVPENRIGQVRVGQSVRVTVDSFPGRAFDGHVARIAVEPEYTPRNVATVEGRLNTFYAVEIHLANPEGLLKPGMPADATFD